MIQNRARLRTTIKIGLFEQNGGWVFIGIPENGTFYDEPLFSGKRRSLEDAMSTAKKLAGPDKGLVYSRLDKTINDWNY